jgi:hypothetical protein
VLTIGGFVTSALLLEDDKKEEFTSELIDVFQLSCIVLIDTKAG